MARFRFRLQTLQRLREMHRDEMRARLAEAYQAERILSEQRAAVDAETAAISNARRQMIDGGTFDVNRMLDAQRYQLLLEAQSRTMAEQAARLAEEAETRRAALVEADREVRVLDKLRERRLAQHHAAAEAADAKRLDDIAVMRHGAKQS